MTRKCLLFVTILAITEGRACCQGLPPSRYDLVIDEIMADPTPAVQLPNAEYIELKNISGHTIDITGCRLRTSSKESGALPAYALPADGFLILTATSHQQLLAAYGATIGVSGFPAITNSGTTLSLVGPDGSTIHAVRYDLLSYQNDIKKQGGWSLEMIDTHDPCRGPENWKASEDPRGGTPGVRNSVDGTAQNDASPQLERTVSSDSLTVLAIFDKPLDSLSASLPSHYSFSNGISILAANPQPPLFNTVRLTLDTPMDPATVYTLQATDVSDCRGNPVGAHHTAYAGVALDPGADDIVVNEILYNPRPAAYDYVELYNRGHNAANLASLYIANRDETGALKTIRACSDSAFFLFPGTYAVVTESRTSLAMQYLVRNPGAVLEISGLPSFPNDKGTVVLLNSQGSVVDEVSYSDSWQFPLINNPDGVALERIDPDGPSQEAKNWHSASTTSGYGTPTYENSQYLRKISNSTLSIQPTVFSPDNDGHDDFAVIAYQMDRPGYVANSTVFDAYGNAVRHLVSNAILGRQGQWTWDGLNDKGQRLAMGIYVVFTEIFDLQGAKRSFKLAVTLVRKL